MKARKALKRLNKVDSMLSNVIDGLGSHSNGLGDLLASAKQSVLRAKEELKAEVSSSDSKKPVAKPAGSRVRRLSAAGRKRISEAAKKRWAAVRYKRINSVTGDRLKKTA